MNTLKYSNDGGKTLFSEFSPEQNDFSEAKVDIIIPFRNCYQSVIDLVDSLLNATTGCSYLVTLVDDGSTNRSFGINIARKKPVLVIRKEESVGYGEAVNSGLRATQNPYVTVLHSDCKITQSGWLSALGNHLIAHRDAGVKLVHPRTNNPTIDNHPQLPPTNLNEQSGGGIATEPLPLVCFLCNRELFNRVGLFQPYYPAGYENYEFFSRMRRMKYKQSVCLDSFVFHHGGRTIETLSPKEITMIENNYDRFIADHKSSIGQKSSS